VNLYKDDLKYLAAGVTFLGGGGGGTLRAGLKMIDANLKTGKSDKVVELVSIDDIRDDDRDLTVACGFLASQTDVEDSTNIEDLGIVLEAYRKIAEDEGLGRIARLVPIELGVQSCVLPICLTANALNNSNKGWDLKVLDADGAGRTVPLICATTFACASFEKKISLFPALFGGMIPVINGVPAGPFWMRFQGEDCTSFHLQTTASSSTAAFGDSAAALVCWPMKSKVEVKDALPPGVRRTLSLSLELGKILSDKTGNPVQAAMQFLDKHDRKSFHIFQGTIESVSKDQHRVELTNGKDSLVVVSDGENMVAINEGQPKAMAPDSICYVTEDGVPISSAEVNELKEKGESVTVHVVGIPAREEIRKSELVKQAFQYFRNESMHREKTREEGKLAIALVKQAFQFLENEGTQGKKAKENGRVASASSQIDLNGFKPIEELNPSSTAASAK
jgi:DUF917 family protein